LRRTKLSYCYCRLFTCTAHKAF